MPPSDKLSNPVWLHFRATVSTAMKRLDLKGYELAQRTGVTPSSVVGWLREGSLPKGRHLMNLAKVLGMDAEDLVPSAGRTVVRKGADQNAYVTGGLVALSELELALKALRERWEQQGQGERASVASEIVNAAVAARQPPERARRTKGS